MIEFQLSTHAMSKPIVRFDGQIVEFFFDSLDGGSLRMHVGHIKSIEVVPVSRGKEKYSLQIKSEYQIVAVDASETVLPKVNQMIAEIQKAMPAFR